MLFSVVYKLLHSILLSFQSLTTSFGAGSTGKGRIELLLAIGASRMEASRETMQRCLVLALTPVLNQMSVMGVVSIPGMMTGQILGGTSPSQVAYLRGLLLLQAQQCV